MSPVGVEALLAICIAGVCKSIVPVPDRKSAVALVSPSNSISTAPFGSVVLTL